MQFQSSLQISNFAGLVVTAQNAVLWLSRTDESYQLFWLWFTRIKFFL